MFLAYSSKYPYNTDIDQWINFTVGHKTIKFCAEETDYRRIEIASPSHYRNVLREIRVILPFKRPEYYEYFQGFKKAQSREPFHFVPLNLRLLRRIRTSSRRFKKAQSENLSLCKLLDFATKIKLAFTRPGRVRREPLPYYKYLSLRLERCDDLFIECIVIQTLYEHSTKTR